MKNLIQNLLKNEHFARVSNVGLLCNQVSFDFVSHRYLFDILHTKHKLKRLFVPEHGLFGELQDQEKLNETDVYAPLGLDGVDVKSLYQHDENSLIPKLEDLNDLDALVIDIQDVGCRYFTFTSTIFYLFEGFLKYNLSPKIFILDRPNPAGDFIEGTPISSEYASFIGLDGLPHRHGMTIAELCFWFQEKLSSNFELIIISDNEESCINALSINPSPNIPNFLTPYLYAGQCLFEGTTWSEGRGTTRPFEIVGSPMAKWSKLNKIAELSNEIWNEHAILRPLSFIPTFHKFMGIKCNGFQLHLIDKVNYRSLFHSMQILRLLAEIEDEFWRIGKYEFGSEKTAIEVLIGDTDLLDFVNGKNTIKLVDEKLKNAENEWLRVRENIRKLIKRSI